MVVGRTKPPKSSDARPRRTCRRADKRRTLALYQDQTAMRRRLRVGAKETHAMVVSARTQAPIGSIAPRTTIWTKFRINDSPRLRARADRARARGMRRTEGVDGARLTRVRRDRLPAGAEAMDALAQPHRRQ